MGGKPQELPSRSHRGIAAALLATLVAFFFVDLIIPRGFASGVLYLAVIALAFWLPGHRYTLAVAIVCTVLMPLKLLVATTPLSQATMGTLAVVNRLLSIGMVWITAIVSLYGKRAEQGLRESEHRFQIVADRAPVLIWMADDAKACVFCNRGWLEFTGRTLAQELGQGWTEAIHPADFDRRQEVFDQAFAARQEFRLEYRLRYHHLEYRWVLESGSPWYTADGVFAGYIGSCIDITDRKRAEEAREALTKTIEEKNKELESLVYVASHDLRSPLVNVQGFGQELARSCEEIRSLVSAEPENGEAHERLLAILDQDVPESLRYIQVSANKMDTLLNGLLRISRLGRQTLTLRPVDMNALIKTVLAAMEFLIAQSKTTVHVDPLPPCQGDEAQLNQVFSNLVDNALKYRHPDRPGEIRIFAGEEPQRVIYCVADNGIGIAPEHARRVFELFHRLHPKDGDGEGLGLAIAQRIVIRHGGQTWVESVVGEGSKFFVALPAGATMSSLVDKPPAPPGASNVSGSGR